MEFIGVLFVIGRVLYGGFFLMAGLNHMLKLPGMSGYAASKGIPSPMLLTVISGLMIMAGGVGIILGVYVAWAIFLIATFLVTASIKMHNFWAITDPMAKMTERTQFMKNMGLLGAAFMLLSVPTPWPMSIIL